MQLTELRDEDLKLQEYEYACIGGAQDEQDECFQELWRRYKNKKKECEDLRKIVAKQEDQMSRASFLLKFRHSLEI